MSDIKQLAADLHTGTVLAGRYRIEQLLGKGGMGAVYRAVDEKMTRQVAIKVINEDKRLSNEITALAALRHPHIVNIHAVEVDMHLSAPFLVLEFINGRMLSDIGKQSTEECARLGLQALSALAEAHSKNIVHRDLKPQNMMQDEHNQLKLLDFGLAKVLGVEEQRLTQTGEIIGTAHYISPEQCLGKEITPRTDIYSLGASLYFMATGQPPFTGDSPLQVCLKQTNDDPDFSLISDERLAKIIAKAMAKAPENRFQSADEMAEALRSQNISINLTASKPSQQPHRRKPIAMLLLLAALAGASFAAYRFTQPSPPPAINDEVLDAEQARRKLTLFHEQTKDRKNEWWQYHYLERVERLQDDYNLSLQQKEMLQHALVQIADEYGHNLDRMKHLVRLSEIVNMERKPLFSVFIDLYDSYERVGMPNAALNYVALQIKEAEHFDTDTKSFMLRVDTYMLHHHYVLAKDAANVRKIDKALAEPDAATLDERMLQTINLAADPNPADPAWLLAKYYLETAHSHSAPDLRHEAEEIVKRAQAATAKSS